MIIEVNHLYSQFVADDKCGQQLYDLICKNRGQEIVINMRNINSVSSVFLNVSIGRLIEEDRKDFVKQHIKFAEVTKAQVVRLKEYFDRFKE